MSEEHRDDDDEEVVIDEDELGDVADVDAAVGVAEAIGGAKKQSKKHRKHEHTPGIIYLSRIPGYMGPPEIRTFRAHDSCALCVRESALLTSNRRTLLHRFWRGGTYVLAT